MLGSFRVLNILRLFVQGDVFEFLLQLLLILEFLTDFSVKLPRDKVFHNKIIHYEKARLSSHNKSRWFIFTQSHAYTLI